jgi:hypothetical protein
MHDSNKVTENDDANPLIAIVGLMELLRWPWQLLRRLLLMCPLNL